MRHHSYLLLALLLGTLALSAGLVGCDSANPVAPSGSTVTVTANPTLIALNQSSTITVTGFKPDGNPLNPGSQVNLTTDLGVLDATIVSIGDNGRATTVLRADGRTGTATVTASLPAGEATATAAVQIGENAESKPTLSIVVSPNTLDLGETASVETQARNADGSLMGAGGRVVLRTSLGELDETNLVTDQNGEASTTLRTGDDPGTATITGSVDSSDEVTVDVTIEVQSPNLIINANPDTIPLGESSVSVITIIARDNNNVPLGAGNEINVFTTLGSLQINGREVDSVTTNSSGRAELDLVATGSESGDATVTAILGSSDPATTTVTIRGDVESVDLIAPASINIGDQTIVLQAQVLDNRNTPVSSVFVSFSTNPTIGEFQRQGTSSTGTVSTNNQGVAVVDLVLTQQELEGAGLPTNADGNRFFTVTVTAPTEGEPISVSQDIVVN